MTTAELLQLFRGLSADNTPKYLWSDELLCRLATEAEKEAASRARLIVDSVTEDLCVKELDMVMPGWEEAVAGETTNYCGNYQNGRIYFINPLEADDIIRLTVVREPLNALRLSGPAVDPEIPPRYHEKLVHWMFWRALSTRDVEEKYDPVVAKQQKDEFEGVFGPQLRAIDEKWFQDEHGYDEYEGLL